MKLLFFLFFAMMNITEARRYFQQQLPLLIKSGEDDEIFIRIVEHLTSKTKFDIKTNSQLEIAEDIFKDIITQLKSNKPIQYILGHEWFYNLKLKVNEHVLIPRPETEELVRWVIEFIQSKNKLNLSILDIGTGSGCIPICLKKEIPALSLSALDIDKAALEVAKENAFTYQTTIEWIEGDILDPNLNLHKSFDILVSNPPYITLNEKINMSDRVLQFEPSNALFVNNEDPLQFYKAILQFSNTQQVKAQCIFLEVNSAFAKQVEELFIHHQFTTELRKDMYGNERMLLAQKN